MNKLHLGIVLSILAVSTLLPLSAGPTPGVIVNDTASSGTGVQQVGNVNGVGTDFSFAQGFTMPPTALTYSLSSVTLSLETDTEGATSGATYDVSLYSSNAGLPGSLIATISSGNLVSNLSTTATNKIFNLSADADVLLSGSTSYWLVLSSTSDTGGNAYWSFTGSPASNTAPGTLDSSAESLQGPSGTWTQDTTTQFKMEIIAPATVPEPSTYALMALGALMMISISVLKRGINL
jgi:hypothetical protein